MVLPGAGLTSHPSTPCGKDDSKRSSTGSCRCPLRVGAPVAAFAQTGGTVALLPFTNITGEPGDAWIGAGIAETLIADLQGAPGFEVVTGEQIGAPWVVSGAYERVGNQIRITARLVEVASGAVIRTAMVDGTMDDLFSLHYRPAMDLAGRPGIPASRLAATEPPAAAVFGPPTGTSGGAGMPALIDGPPPHVAPDVISRDERGRATIRAIKLDDGLIVDGALDEAIYKTVPSCGGFIQTEPHRGGAGDRAHRGVGVLR